jgi:hypothetical protein|eukprot:COSAG03_NODE_82_length_13990_cov_63.581744_2_plen_90_part_00
MLRNLMHAGIALAKYIAQYDFNATLQAVDRARQRQREEEKARDRLLPGSGPATHIKAEETDGGSAAETEAPKVRRRDPSAMARLSMPAA